MYDITQTIPEQIRYASPEEISDILPAVIQRFSEVYPDWEIMVATVPRNDFDEQIRILQNTIDFLTRSKEKQK